MKFKLKVTTAAASNIKKADEKEEKNRMAAVIPHRRGRPPKK